MAPKDVDADTTVSNMLNIVFRDETRFSEYVQVREMFGQAGIFRLLKKAGSDSVMKACQEGPWDFHKMCSLAGIGGIMKKGQAGVYLHVISLKENVSKWWLYVGQAKDLDNRTRKQHSSPRYRRTHPSLHYSVFQPEIMNDVFVLISEAPPETLRGNDLLEWLPVGVHLPNPGQHLNVALPIRQSNVAGNPLDHAMQLERFAQLRFSDDLTQRQHFWSVVKSWNDLRYSPDPAVRAFYWDRINLRGIKPSAYYAEGVALQVRSFHYGHVLNIFGYPVHIPAGVECTGVKEAKVFMLLSEGDKRHPQCHATRALDSDPAKRFALRLELFDRHNEIEKHWLHCQGERAVMFVNTIVDRLEEVDKATIKLTPRRSYWNAQGTISFTSAVNDTGEAGANTRGKVFKE